MRWSHGLKGLPQWPTAPGPLPRKLAAGKIKTRSSLREAQLLRLPRIQAANPRTVPAVRRACKNERWEAGDAQGRPP